MEKLYHSMKSSGIIGIIAGICTVITGIIIIISGILLLRNRSDILF